LAGGDFILLASAWRVLYQAQQSHALTTFGPYAYVRHPQYPAFVLIMLRFLVQWRTLGTLVMFLVLVAMYVCLARREERERSPPWARLCAPRGQGAGVVPDIFRRITVSSSTRG
jgi:hypothetical protein